MRSGAWAIFLGAALLGAAPGSAKIIVVAGSEPGQLKEPFAVDFDAAGSMFIAELSGGRVLKVDKAGALTPFAGTGAKGDGGDGGPAAKAQFNGMHHLAITPDGDIYIADTWNQRVRKIDAKTGVISTVAGTGKKGFAGDGGPAEKAEFGGIYSLAFDAKHERLYLADLDNRRIRMVHLKTGVVTTVAGNGEKGVPRDGADAKASPLVDPRAVAVDSKGNVYVLERGGHALRVVDGAGRIRTVAGTGQKGLSGDGGDALKAAMNGPKHLTCDADDSVLIADAENNVVRRYLPREGRIVRVAGTGKKGSAGVGGPPEQAELARPHGVYVHPSGALYITDSYNDRILKIEK